MLKGEITFPVFVSSEAKSFIRGVLVRRPEDRLGSGSIGMLEMKHHPFFSGIQWNSLLEKETTPPKIHFMGIKSNDAFSSSDGSGLLSRNSTFSPKGKQGVQFFANVDMRKEKKPKDSIDNFIN